VTLYPEKFLTRCVVCNGKIIEVFDREQQKAIFDQYASPDFGEELDHVYKCNSCGQGYWWSSSPTSSASRVKDNCTHLLKLCLRGGVRVEGQPLFFSHIDYDAERKVGEDNRSRDGERSDGGTDEVLGWLQESKLQSPFSLKSSYATEMNGKVDGELLPFTNVTSDFVGALDYILYEQNNLEQIGRLKIPTDFRTLNATALRNGHLLPSDIWPSDHLCIGSQFSLQTLPIEEESKQGLDSTSSSIPSAYVVPPGTTSNTSIPSAYVPPGTIINTSIPSAYVPPGTISNTSIPSAYVPPGTIINTSIPSAYVPPGTISNTSIPSAYVPPGTISNTSIPSAYVPPGTIINTTDKHSDPVPGCECGCVPKILSLFQMAELRKAHRKKKLAENQATN
jgi:hypothetical protein